MAFGIGRRGTPEMFRPRLGLPTDKLTAVGLGLGLGLETRLYELAIGLEPATGLC